MTRRILLGSLVSVVIVAGLAAILVASRDPHEAEVTAAPAPRTCPPAVRTPGVVVSYTMPASTQGGRPSGGPGVSFVRNVGQADRRVRYSAVSGGLAVYVTDAGIVVATRGGAPRVVRLVPVDPSPGVAIEARRRRPTRVSYYAGDRRFTDVPVYGDVAYRGMWPGIDLVLRSDRNGVKYEFDVAPGADAGRIRMAYRGAGRVTLSEAGDLLVGSPPGSLRDPRPVAYQDLDGGRAAVESRYSLAGSSGTFGFVVGPHDPARPLVIDPGLEYSGYVGGSGTDFVRSMAVDGAGNMYVAGGTMSGDLPVSAHALDTVYRGEPDAFVAKLDPAGHVVYQTYLGGHRSETALSIAVDRSGHAYVSGGSNSDDFPTTPGAFARHRRNEDVWVAKLDPTGSKLDYATFLPGTAVAGDFGNAVGVDASGHAYVAGGTGSPDFPTTPGAFDRSHNGKVDALDAFVAKLKPDGSGLVYSTFVGGTCNDVVNGMTVTPEGSVQVVGSTVSRDFPTTAKAFGARYHGGEDAFVAELSGDGAELVYSSFLGGRGVDNARAVAVGRDGSRYVTGWTRSDDFPVTPHGFDRTFGGDEDAFVVKVSGDGERLAYGTYLGGEGAEEGWGVGVDRRDRVVVAGATSSVSFPTTPGAIDRRGNGDQDVFVTMLDGAGASLVASTYLGGAGLDAPRAFALGSGGKAYVAGRTSSTDFPTAGAPTRLDGTRDGFVSRLRLRTP